MHSRANARYLSASDMVQTPSTALKEGGAGGSIDRLKRWEGAEVGGENGREQQSRRHGCAGSDQSHQSWHAPTPPFLSPSRLILFTVAVPVKGRRAAPSSGCRASSAHALPARERSNAGPQSRDIPAGDMAHIR